MPDDYNIGSKDLFNHEWLKLKEVNDGRRKEYDFSIGSTNSPPPSITTWNRIESRTRSEDDTGSGLRAEVRDPLWMLTRQWQMGEFRGEDAGSPVLAKIHAEARSFSLLKKGKDAPTVNNNWGRNVAADNLAQFSEDLPLETQIEQIKLPFENEMSMDLRILMGRRWLKSIKKSGDFKQHFINKYPINLLEEGKPEQAHISANVESIQYIKAMSGKMMDGFLLYQKMDENDTFLEGIEEDNKIDLKEKAIEFKKWFESLYSQPVNASSDAWDPAALEYQFSLATDKSNGSGNINYNASEYYTGHLDWYSMDFKSWTFPVVDTSDKKTLSYTKTLLPTEVSFGGMPNTRWWAFEDNRINFGRITPKVTDPARLLLIEFGLVYANDWYVVPFTLPVGTVTQIKGIVVTNTFGEHYWIDVPTSDANAQGEQEEWSMFKNSLSLTNDSIIDNSRLLLLPTVEKVQEGKPQEEVTFIRDEMANMVWGIETTIPLVNGKTKPGKEAARELVNFYEKSNSKSLATVETTGEDSSTAAISYQFMISVPENWIPFIPVHMRDENKKIKLREVMLQRSAMPRFINSETEKVEPRTNLLREGLDVIPSKPYFINEEEIPRAGSVVTKSYQRTRWYGGKVVNWLGIRKQVGRGEGSSNLMFDNIVPNKKNED